MIKNLFLRAIGKLYTKSFLNRINDVYTILDNIRKGFTNIRSMKKNDLINCYLRAIHWIKVNTIDREGIIISSKKRFNYPEVTGYFIPTLIEVGEHKLAKQYAIYLSEVQSSNGAIIGPDGKEYVFDTGQALMGLLRASNYWNKFKPNAQKAADYIVSSIDEEGRFESIYGKTIPEHIHVFVLPSLLEAGRTFNRPQYIEAAEKSLLYYKNDPNVLDPHYLTHFLAYIIDGFIEMNELKFVYPIVKDIYSNQNKRGAIPAFPDVKWICTPGVAQFAIIGYKLGMIENADRAINYLCQIQNPSGGFYGSYGFYAKYFNLDEVSWANKFFLDAIHMKISAFFNHHADIFPTNLSQRDGRLEAVLTHLGPFKNKKILDVGCGKGRFAFEIKRLYPTCEVHGVDISEKLLKEVPDSIIIKRGSILNLPYENETFDGIYCIEVLEHAIRIKRAIKELCRVLKNNGKIVIIDKNIEKLGRLKITSFEQWFDGHFIINLLKKYCRDVQINEISYDDHRADGLFLSWSGIRDIGLP